MYLYYGEVSQVLFWIFFIWCIVVHVFLEGGRAQCALDAFEWFAIRTYGLIGLIYLEDEKTSYLPKFYENRFIA